MASFDAASAVWRMPGYATGTAIEVSRRRGLSGNRPSFGRLHEPRVLPAWHTTTVGPIPITSTARTILDVAGRLRPERIEQLVHAVVARSPATLGALHRLLEELAPNRRTNFGVLRAVLAELPVGSRPFGSNLERRVHRLLAQAGEPPLERQVDLGGDDYVGRVDFLDRPTLVVFEVDSELHHTSPSDRRRDAIRDEALIAAGYRAVVRIPEEHVWWQPSRVLAAVRDTRRRYGRDTAPQTSAISRPYGGGLVVPPGYGRENAS